MQIAVVIIVVVAATLIAVAMVRVRAKAADGKSQAEVMRALRLQAIEMEPPASAGDDAWAVVMDIGFPAATASVLGSDGGDASLYLSNGGGVLGGIGHASVRAAAKTFVAEARKQMAQLQATTEYPTPPVGAVRFYVRTRAGVYTAERDEKALGAKQDPLWPLFYAGHGVLTKLRQITPGK